MITIEELKLKINKNSRLIGLDLGSKRVGVAICDEKKLIATPLKTVNLLVLSSLISELKAIINEYRIEGIIVGYPLNMDGSTGSSSQSIKDKVINISKEIHIPICLWDERLSTVGVFNISSQLDVNINKRTKKIDENAAAFILQGAIDYINN
jgi:putative Holliday junction resolvase